MRPLSQSSLFEATTLLGGLLLAACTLDREGTLSSAAEGGAGGTGGTSGSAGAGNQGGTAGNAGSSPGGMAGAGPDASVEDGATDVDAADAPTDVPSDVTEAGEADAALTCADDPCGPNTKCDDSSGTVICTCLHGYESDPSGEGCVDIDECATAAHDCVDGATCENEPGSYSCTCNPGLIGDGTTSCRVPVSCAELAAEVPGQVDGTFTIDPDGAGGPIAPVSVFCDMTSDQGVGYTMVRFDDAGLEDHQDSYHKFCADHGMEVIVPRTRAHAKAIVAWLGAPPNLVGVYPRGEDEVGLNGFVGRCGGADCSFYMSDTRWCDCVNNEPNGNNDPQFGLIRSDDSQQCGFWGRWDDNDEHVELEGWVVCSTNDAGPMQPRPTCQAYMVTESVWNQASQGISGAYPLDPDGTGPRPTTYTWCDHRTDDGAGRWPS